MELAKAVKLPISIHCRDATGDMLKILKDNKDKLEYGGVMHCFTSSWNLAKTMLDRGFFFSASGILIFNTLSIKFSMYKFLILWY